MPNLASILPNIIILYTFGVSLDFWSLESGHLDILESPGFGEVGYWTLTFNAEFHKSIIPGIFQELSGTLELLWQWTNFWQVWHVGYIFHSIFGLELNFQGGICQI